MENLEKNAFITRFEAFELYIHYKEKSKKSENDYLQILPEIYTEKAQKWLDIACEIEATNSDGAAEYLEYNTPYKLLKR